MKIFKDYVEIILGGTPSTNRTDFWDGEIPWVSIVDFNNNRKIYETEKTITEAGLRQSNTKLLNEGDIIISARGTVGKVVVCGKRMAFNQSCYALKTKDKNELNQNYLFYLIQEKIKYLKQMAVGGVFNTIIKSTLERIPIEIPPINIQEKISEILLRYEDLIEINNRCIKLLEEAARLLYREWFVHFRFPGHEKVKIVDGIPESWEKGHIKNLTDVQSGYAFKSEDWHDEGNPVVKIKNIVGDGSVKLNNYSYVNHVNHDVASKVKNFLLKKGDLLIAMTGATIGKVGLLSEKKEKVYLNQRVGKFSPNFDGAELIYIVI